MRTPPSQVDFYPFGGCLDAQSAWRNFGGLTLEQGHVRFCSAPEVYQEDFMFMGCRALFLPDKSLRQLRVEDSSLIERARFPITNYSNIDKRCKTEVAKPQRFRGQMSRLAPHFSERRNPLFCPALSAFPIIEPGDCFAQKIDKQGQDCSGQLNKGEDVTIESAIPRNHPNHLASHFRARFSFQPCRNEHRKLDIHSVAVLLGMLGLLRTQNGCFRVWRC